MHLMDAEETLDGERSPHRFCTFVEKENGLCLWSTCFTTSTPSTTTTTSIDPSALGAR